MTSNAPVRSEPSRDDHLTEAGQRRLPSGPPGCPHRPPGGVGSRRPVRPLASRPPRIGAADGVLEADPAIATLDDELAAAVRQLASSSLLGCALSLACSPVTCQPPPVFGPTVTRGIGPLTASERSGSMLFDSSMAPGWAGARSSLSRRLRSTSPCASSPSRHRGDSQSARAAETCRGPWSDRPNRGHVLP